MRTPSVMLLAAAALAASASPASAAITSTWEASPHILTVTSDDAGDTIDLTCGTGGLLVSGAPPSSGALPCTGGATAHTLVLIGNGGGDTIDVDAVEEQLAVGTITVDAGDGDDVLRGENLGFNNESVTLLGGPGADTLTVNRSDVADGGPGDDRFDGELQFGPDGTLTGGDGTDSVAFDFSPVDPIAFTFTFTDTGMTISAPGVAATQKVEWTAVENGDIKLGEGGQTVDGSSFAGTVNVAAGGGSDTLIGTGGADVLDGGTGNDFIEGGGGADVYHGGNGFDLLHARDGIADTGDCGSDEDTLVADAGDAIADCERIDLPPPPPPLPDVTAPALGVERAALRNRRVRVPVSCPANEVRCAGIATLTAVGRRAGRTVRVRLGASTFELDGGTNLTIVKRVSRKRMRTLRTLKGLRLRVALQVVDASSNRATSVQRVGLDR